VETPAAHFLLYPAYKQWSANNGLKPMSTVTFGKRLKKCFDNIKSSGVMYQAIGLLAEPKAK
jgi:phage/plasmid-associated DNA primase